MPTLKKAKKYIDKAREIESKYKIPTNTLVGLLATESAFDEDIITGKKKSSAGAIGIAQFMQKTAESYGIDPLNTDQAIDAAGKYLASSYKTFGNWDDSLRSYNMGIQGVKDWKRGVKKLPKETEEYTGKVWKFAKMYGGKTIPETNTPENEQETTQTNNFQYNYTPQNTTTVTNLPEAEKTINFEEEQDKIVANTTQKEQNFLKEYQESFSQQEEVEQEEQPVYQLPQTNYIDMFNQVSQFVDSRVAQQGGKQKYTENELAFLSELESIPSSPNGLYDFPNQIVKVKTKDGRITMKNIDYNVLGIDEYGNKKVMQPEKEYKFQGKNILEIPLK